jgi:hypothetical protein
MIVAYSDSWTQRSAAVREAASRRFGFVWKLWIIGNPRIKFENIMFILFFLRNIRDTNFFTKIYHRYRTTVAQKCVTSRMVSRGENAGPRGLAE